MFELGCHASFDVGQRGVSLHDAFSDEVTKLAEGENEGRWAISEGKMGEGGTLLAKGESKGAF